MEEEKQPCAKGTSPAIGDKDDDKEIHIDNDDNDEEMMLSTTATKTTRTRAIPIPTGSVDGAGTKTVATKRVSFPAVQENDTRDGLDESHNRRSSRRGGKVGSNVAQRKLSTLIPALFLCVICLWVQVISLSRFGMSAQEDKESFHADDDKPSSSSSSSSTFLSSFLFFAGKNSLGRNRIMSEHGQSNNDDESSWDPRDRTYEYTKVDTVPDTDDDYTFHQDGYFAPSLHFRFRSRSYYKDDVKLLQYFCDDDDDKKDKNVKEVTWEFYPPQKDTTNTTTTDSTSRSTSTTATKSAAKTTSGKRLLIALHAGYDEYASYLTESAHIAKSYAKKWGTDNVQVVVLQGTAFVSKQKGSSTGCKEQQRKQNQLSNTMYKTMNKIRLLFYAIDHKDEYDQLLLLEADVLINNFNQDITKLLMNDDDVKKESHDKNKILLAAQPMHKLQEDNTPAIATAGETEKEAGAVTSLTFSQTNLNNKGKSSSSSSLTYQDVHSGVTLWNLHHDAIRSVAIEWLESSKQALITSLSSSSSSTTTTTAESGNDDNDNQNYNDYSLNAEQVHLNDALKKLFVSETRSGSNNKDNSKSNNATKYIHYWTSSEVENTMYGSNNINKNDDDDYNNATEGKETTSRTSIFQHFQVGQQHQQRQGQGQQLLNEFQMAANAICVQQETCSPSPSTNDDNDATTESLLHKTIYPSK